MDALPEMLCSHVVDAHAGSDLDAIDTGCCEHVDEDTSRIFGIASESPSHRQLSKIGRLAQLQPAAVSRIE